MVTNMTLMLLMLQFGFSPAVDPKPAVFDVLYDNTLSTGSDFASYAELLCKTVLQFVRPGDTVVLTPFTDIDSKPDSLTIDDSRRSALATGFAQFAEHAKKISQQKTGGTDFGKIFDHIQAQMNLDSQLHNGAVTHYIVLITDGQPDGAQSKAERTATPFPSQWNWKILFVGIKPGNDVKMTGLAAQHGFSDPQRVLVVPYALAWQVDLSHFFGRDANGLTPQGTASPYSSKGNRP